MILPHNVTALLVATAAYINLTTPTTTTIIPHASNSIDESTTTLSSPSATFYDSNDTRTTAANTTPIPPTATSPFSAGTIDPLDTFAAAAAIAAMAGSVPASPDEPLDRCHPYNTHFNCTASEYLLFSRGPQTVAWTFLLPVTVLYTAVFCAGTVGNVLVCWVIVRHPAMHTATNYYLFSLAASDLLYLVAGLPYDVSVFWWQYPYVLGLAVCKLRAWISEAATYVSVLTILAFSTERYLAICHPLYVYALGGHGRAARIVAAVWALSFAAAAPFGVYSEISYIQYPPWDEREEARLAESAFCAMLDNPPGLPLWELSSVCFFVLPMAVMVVLYALMGLAIRRRSKQQSILGVREQQATMPTIVAGGGSSVRSTNGNGSGGQGSGGGGGGGSQSRRAIIRMLAAVCLTFFVSWAPFHAQRLMFLYAHDWEDYELLNVWLFSVAGLFYYVSCTVNPVLYNVMSHRYRRAFRETLFGDGAALRRRPSMSTGGLGHRQR